MKQLHVTCIFVSVIKVQRNNTSDIIMIRSEALWLSWRSDCQNFRFVQSDTGAVFISHIVFSYINARQTYDNMMGMFRFFSTRLGLNQAKKPLINLRNYYCFKG